MDQSVFGVLQRRTPFTLRPAPKQFSRNAVCRALEIEVAPKFCRAIAKRHNHSVNKIPILCVSGIYVPARDIFKPVFEVCWFVNRSNIVKIISNRTYPCGSAAMHTCHTGNDLIQGKISILNLIKYRNIITQICCYKGEKIKIFIMTGYVTKYKFPTISLEISAEDCLQYFWIATQSNSTSGPIAD